MEKFNDWMEKKSHIILAVFISIHCIITAIFLVLYFIEEIGNISVLYKIYSSALLGIFTVFMVHFAHHSVSGII